MQKPRIITVQRWALILFWLTALNGRAAESVEIVAEIETVAWPPKDAAGEILENPTSRTGTIRGVVGAKTWLMEGDFIANGKQTVWFTGTHIITHSVITKLPSKDMELYERNHGRTYSHVGHQFTNAIESVDGNPAGPARTMDPVHMASAKNFWLAFCSGSFLKRQGRQIFPPDMLWKELVSAPFGFADKTTVFEDDLGLPSSADLSLPGNSPVLQYRVSRSTNVLGWDFPLEFHLAQYRPARAGGWELQLTAKGKVTTIGKGVQSQISMDK